MTERHARLLATFADQAASLAADLHAAALKAETCEEKQGLSVAFHRMGRALRQSIALEAKLRRDLARAEREDRADAAEVRGARRATVKASARATLRRLIEEQGEDIGGRHGREFARLGAEQLERVLDEDEAHDAIPEDAEQYIEDLRRQFGLDLAGGGHDLEDDEGLAAEATDAPPPPDAPGFPAGEAPRPPDPPSSA